MNKKIRDVDILALINSLYFCFVWVAYFYVNISSSTKLNLLLSIFIISVGYPFFKSLMALIRKIDIKTYKKKSDKSIALVFIGTTLFVFAILFLWWLAYYPGSFSKDSMKQIGQAVSGSYNDWHPVWHTLLFFTFPLSLFKTPSAIIGLQILYFSLILGYLSLTIYELSSLKLAVLVILYIIMNPYTGYMVLYPWKDVAFAMGGLLCTIIAIRFILLKRNTITIWDLIIFSELLVSTTLFRHNAILFTLPLVLVLFLHMDKKNCIVIALCSVCMLLVIRGIVYPSIGVEKPGNRVLESTGLPLTIIGNVAKETPDLMDEELSDFVYAIAPQEQWQQNYKCGNFNVFKWSGVSLSLVEEEGYGGMLKLMTKCFLLSPQASVKALLSLTDMVYGFETGLEGNVGAYIAENDFGIEYKNDRNQHLLDLITTYTSFINGTVFRYLRTYGVCLLVLLTVYLGKLNIKDTLSLKKALIAVPIFSYDFGTMLFLTGADSRFFFITFLVTPLLVFYVLYKGEEGNV